MFPKYFDYVFSPVFFWQIVVTFFQKRQQVIRFSAWVDIGT